MPATERLHVLVIAQDRRIRRAPADLLATEPGLAVCGTARDRHTALTLANAQRPDAALLDLPQPDPAEALRLLVDLHHLGIPVIVLSTSASQRHQALSSGAAAFLEKARQLAPHTPIPARTAPPTRAIAFTKAGLNAFAITFGDQLPAAETYYPRRRKHRWRRDRPRYPGRAATSRGGRSEPTPLDGARSIPWPLVSLVLRLTSGAITRPLTRARSTRRMADLNAHYDPGIYGLTSA